LAGPSGAYDSDGELEEMIDINRVEGRVKASSLKRVSQIVDKHPEESLAILRSWLHTER
jgi:flagellar M-ring protein FliF